MCPHDFQIDTLENLETNLASCGVYECFECEKLYKSLNDIEIHLENDLNKDINFFPLKMNRILKEKVDFKKYSYCDV